MAEKLRWGIIGAGNIAKAFATALPHSRTGVLSAVGSRDAEKARTFSAQFGGGHFRGTYQEVLDRPDVDAVYIATPHPMHAEWAIRAAEAGKHILCEKPMTLNAGEAMAVIEAARRADVFLMEAFMYRCHPLIAKLVELLRTKVIGEVGVVKATFSFHAGYNPQGRLFADALGGGGILDVGCYTTTSLVRLVAGVAAGKDVAEPLDLKGFGHLSPTGADAWAVADMKFPGDILAQCATGVQLTQDNDVHIYGSEGSIFMPYPWIPAREGGACRIFVKLDKEKERREIVVETKDYLYGIEADVVADNLAARQAPFPAMSWADTLGNIQTLDRWRAAIGVVYEGEKPANVPTVSRRPLAVRAGAAMPTGKIAGFDQPVSRLGFGAMISHSQTLASALYDYFFECGGNFFDTAHIYGGGTCERLLGQWIRTRGIRSRLVILGKGGHTPFCNPADITRQLNESLERMGTDYVDIYMMHRDNLDVPVGEFIDVLNEHRTAGRMRAFGGSNWTAERIDAANAYAAAHGLVGFSAFSNNFSLARMVQPPWENCLSSSTPPWREWLAARKLPVVAWSSQAQGFFARGNPADTSNRDLVRCWYSDDNFQRLARARELAGKLGVTPTAINLAYVLAQPFAVFPLIGPWTIEETRTSVAAVNVKLTNEQCAWLNLE
jgi:aryl-alcohol dehydrogenase-like predicted oxidoreductase/predicted dehydrogenase